MLWCSCRRDGGVCFWNSSSLMQGENRPWCEGDRWLQFFWKIGLKTFIFLPANICMRTCFTFLEEQDWGTVIKKLISFLQANRKAASKQVYNVKVSKFWFRIRTGMAGLLWFIGCTSTNSKVSLVPLGDSLLQSCLYMTLKIFPQIARAIEGFLLPC